MTDVGTTIAPRSDQLNSDDLLAGPITITITKVAAGNSEQPINIHYAGDNGKPYKPGKSMRRVLVNFWGRDGDSYVGRRLTLFRDPTIQFGGIAVGGIRISHMSNIGNDEEMALTATRGSKKIFKVRPLRGEGGSTDNGAREIADELIKRALACDGAEALTALAAREAIVKRRDWLRTEAPDLADAVDEAFLNASPLGADTLTPDNPTSAEGRDDTDMGEAHVDDVHPARAAVDAHIARLDKLELKSDVNLAISDFSANKAALPDDMRQEVEDAENNRLMAFSTVTGG